MLIGSNENPYKRLLEETEEQPFLPLTGEGDFKDKYQDYQDYVTEFKGIDFVNDEEAIIESIIKYFDDRYKRENEYVNSDDYIESQYYDINDMIRDNDYDKNAFIDELAPSELEEPIDEDIVEEFINEYKSEFDLALQLHGNEKVVIATVPSSEEEYSQFDFSDSDTLTISDDIEVSLFSLIRRMPNSLFDELISRLKYSDLEGISNKLIKIRKDHNIEYFNIDVYFYLGGYHGYDVVLNNQNEIKDLFREFLIEKGLLGIRDESNDPWEEEE